MSNVKTIDLTGEETEINFGTDFKYFWIQNLGIGDVYASTKAGIAPGMDGVTVIGAGASARISDIRPYTNTLYLMGKGKVQVVGDYTGYCPFKAAKKGGDSGNVLLADIPLNGSFDGHGCTYAYSSTSDTPVFSDEYGLYLNNAQLLLTVPDLNQYDIVTIDFEFRFAALRQGYIQSILSIDDIQLDNNYQNNAMVLRRFRSWNVNFTDVGTPTSGIAQSNITYSVKMIYDRKKNIVSGTIEGLGTCSNNNSDYSAGWSFTAENEILFGQYGHTSSPMVNVQFYIRNIKVYGKNND